MDVNITHFEIFLEQSLILHQQVILLSLWATWATQSRLNKKWINYHFHKTNKTHWKVLPPAFEFRNDDFLSIINDLFSWNEKKLNPEYFFCSVIYGTFLFYLSWLLLTVELALSDNLHYHTEINYDHPSWTFWLSIERLSGMIRSDKGLKAHHQRTNIFHLLSFILEFSFSFSKSVYSLYIGK